MYFKNDTLLEETQKEDFSDINNCGKVRDWGESKDINKIQKAIIFIEAAFKHHKENKTKQDKNVLVDYSDILKWKISSNPNLDANTASYIYNTLCDGENAHLNTQVRSCVAELAENPATPQNIKDRILKDHQKFGSDEFIIGRLAKNPSNDSSFIEDIYRNHQGQYIEFRTGMGCSWLNVGIAGNPNASESVKLSMIDDLPKIIEEKSQEFNNMSNHPSYFNEIYKAIAENPNTSEHVFDKLYDAKENFKQKMDYTYYVAKNTNTPKLLDKIAKDKNNYIGVYQALFRNENLSADTIDYILDSTDIATSEKSRLAFNSALNTQQLSRVVKKLGNYHIDNVKELLALPTCSLDVCKSLLENYPSGVYNNSTREIIEEKINQFEIGSKSFTVQDYISVDECLSKVEEQEAAEKSKIFSSLKTN